MVHHERKYETITKAAQEKNGVAVLGILFDVVVDPNPILEIYLKNSEKVFEATGKNQTYQDKLLLMDLLPRNKNSFFRYEGSLTTPGCGEAVIWSVFENSIPISIDQVR
jgi:carbonic anhydrase